MPNKVLIVGASGVVGTASVDAFLDAGWDVAAVSRRRPEVRSPRVFQHLSLNLFDAAACDHALRGLGGVTHIVFSALSEKPGLIDGWSDPQQMEINLSIVNRRAIRTTDRRPTLTRVGRLFEGSSALDFI